MTDALGISEVVTGHIPRDSGFWVTGLDLGLESANHPSMLSSMNPVTVALPTHSSAWTPLTILRQSRIIVSAISTPS